MKIQELANKTGMSAYTIRFYEKEGLLDGRHVSRTSNNYREYSRTAIERLDQIKKFQGIGCSLAELRDILRDKDENTRTNHEVIAWLENKVSEVELKKIEYDKMLETLWWMLEYRKNMK